MNNVILIGRLTRDPELRFTAGSGKAVATFTIAVNRGYGRDNEADYFRIVAWDKLGEVCANYLTKGSQVAVQGRLQNNNYETSTGEKRYTVEIIANTVEFLGGGNRSQGGTFSEHANEMFEDDGAEGFDDIDDEEDFPF